MFTALLLFSIFSSFLILQTAARFNSDKSLVLLAGQFLKGHVSLAPNSDLPIGDISKYGGKYYMYFGPLGSVILIPFVAAFGLSFPQIWEGIAILLVSFFVTYALCRRFSFRMLDCLYLSLFFVFSTVLLSTSLINITSYLVEALGVPLTLLSLYFYFGKQKRPILIGLFMGLAILSRITLIFAVIFYVCEFLSQRLTKKQFVILLTPIAICCVILGAYNFIRFHSVIETGYNYHMQEPFPLSKNYEFGRTNLIHVPANLYTFLIKPPVPILYYDKGYVFRFPYLKADPWGMAIWFTSPLFLLLLFKFKKNKYTKNLIITIITIAIPIVTYYSVGFAQFGYRYALDFLPFLFLLLMPVLSPKLSKTAIALITLGVLFNCLYITSLWDVYPLFGIYR